MAAVKTGTWRRIWLNIHLWIGVGLLVVLAPLGLSGSALVWDVQLDRMLSPAHYVAPDDQATLGPSAYLAAAQRAFGVRAAASQVRFPARPGDTVVVTGRLATVTKLGLAGRPAPTLNAWLDPATAKVLDVANPRATAIGIIHQVHGNMLLAAPGRSVVGWLGIAMTISCLTGLWLWWPRGAFAAGFGWRRGPNVFSNLHHLSGFWILVPLFVLSVTGVYIAFPKQSHALVGAPPPRAPAASMDGAVDYKPPGPVKLDADGAAAAVRAAQPGAGLVSLSASELVRGRWVWRVQVAGKGGPPQSLAVDDATGEVKPAKVPPVGGGPGAAQDPISRAVRQVHAGDDTPVLWKAVITVAGVAPTLLGVTGVVIWLRRPRRPRLVRAAA